MKECTSCHKTKPLEDFHRQKAGKGGRRSQCAVCRGKYFAQYYEESYSLGSPMWVNALSKSALRRARKLRLPFDREAVEEALENAPSKCPVLGIPLEASKTRSSHSSPTLDRHDASKGYVRGNLTIMSSRANSIKNDASTEEVALVARFMMQRDKAMGR